MLGDWIKTAFVCTAIAASAVLAPSASAAVINYAPPAIVRPDVAYVAVSESSVSDAVPLYGAPLHQPAANWLVFNNMGFSSVAQFGATAGDFTDGQINLTVESGDNKTISSFRWYESGDYNITNYVGSGTNSVFIEPQALQITVLEINNTPVSLSNNTAQLTYANGTVFTNNLAGHTPVTGNWSGERVVDLVSMFGSSEITKLSVSFNNQLISVASTGGVAQISKKYVEFAPTVVAVPEPAMLGALGVAGMLFLGRRRLQNR